MLIASGTFRAAVVEGRVVGTGGIVRYGQRLGWVAMILVDPESRGRGIGTAIMSELLARTTGLASVGLDATPLGRPVYERLGFRPQGELVRLTPKEFDLLYHLACQPRRVFRRDEIVQDVWGYSPQSGDLRTVDTHIKRLRKKLEEGRDVPWSLATVWGVGYKFDIAE